MIAAPGNIVTLPPVFPSGTTGGSIDWQAQLPQGADYVRIANWTPNSLLVHLAGDTHNIDAWTADVLPAYCRMGLQFTQLAVTPAAALPAGSTATILVTVAYGVHIPGVYPLPLAVSGFVIDSTAADIKDLVGGDDAAIAGNIGKGADAGHQHPGRTEGGVTETSHASANVRFGIAAGTPRLLLDDGAGHLWEIDVSANTLRIFLPGAVKVTVDSTGKVAAVGGVGNETVGHNHGHTHGAHSHSHDHGQNTFLGTTSGGTQGVSGTLATLDHTHTYSQPSALTGIDTTATIPANDTTGESAFHTHAG